MKLYIDSREQHLLKKCSENNVDVIQKQLDLGDILITNDNDVVFCIIERKTRNDMIASIKDGRYKDQHRRLMCNFKPKNILYMLESYSSFSELCNKSVESAIIHSLFRDEIKFMFTKNIDDTLYTIQAIMKRIEKHPEYFTTEQDEVFETTCLEKPREDGYFTMKTIKKSANESILSVHMNMFCQIPGVSQKTALALCEKYGSVYNMTKQVMDICENEREVLLNTIRVNSRKINKNVVQNIIKFLLQI
jgi:ERCC4-type nuclease